MLHGMCRLICRPNLKLQAGALISTQRILWGNGMGITQLSYSYQDLIKVAQPCYLLHCLGEVHHGTAAYAPTN
jgi:hypothetical protein